MMHKPFFSALQPASPSEQPFFFVFKAEEILVCRTEKGVHIPRAIDISMLLSHATESMHYLGVYDAIPCYMTVLAENTMPPAGMVFQSLRAAMHDIDNTDLFFIASRAKQIAHWDASTQFCGRCGHVTQRSPTERAKVCARCAALYYPQLAPVVLALIWRKNEILLARSPHFQKGVYSVLAGFVEPGETLEEACCREVQEEVGVQIKNLQYFGSQPWPFPSNMMIGFIAEHAQGEIVMDPVEIEDAQWFALPALPGGLRLPNALSLSRQMIEAFMQRETL